MVTTRRNPQGIPPQPTEADIILEVPKPASSSSSSSKMSPFLPTRLEGAILALYPITLLAGSMFTYLSTNIRATKSVYSAAHQSFQPPDLAPSYFARKRNVFNLFFVKVGWFWVSAALLLFIFTHGSFGRALHPAPTARRVRAFFRWAGVTVMWALTTQWFFGPPLIDRSFVWSGGACQRISEEKVGLRDMHPLEEVWTHAQCKMAGGTWSGGIDISGHVFLLILGSATLWLEVLPIVLRSQGLREARRVRMADGSIVNASVENEAEREKQESQVTSLGIKVIVGVVALSWWMLFMTAAFFHTWSEKLAGLIVSFFGIWLVYFLPRGIPAVRAVFGMPGV